MANLFDRLGTLDGEERQPKEERRRPLRLVEPEPKFPKHKVPRDIEKLIDMIGRPPAFVIAQLAEVAREEGMFLDTVEWLKANKPSTKFCFKSYVRVLNPTWHYKPRAWRIGGIVQAAYARKDLTPEQQVQAVQALRNQRHLRTF